MTVKSPGGCRPAEAKSTAPDGSDAVSLYTRSTATRDITSQTLSKLSPGTTYTFVLLVKDVTTGAHAERMTYAPLEITTLGGGGAAGASGSAGDGGASSSSAFAIIAIVVAGLLLLALVVAAVVGGVFYAKMRQMRARPNYDLTDVRGLAGVPITMPSDMMEAPLIGVLDEAGGNYDMMGGGDFALMDDGGGDTGAHDVGSVYESAGNSGSLLSQF